MPENFKTCMFGGFDRQSVVDYIEKISRESRERIQQLEAELSAQREESAALRQKNEELSGELGVLRKMTGDAELAKNENEMLKKEAEELRGRVTELEEKNAVLQTEHADYQVLKDHITDIELQAHRDTEIFRTAAVADLKETIGRQREWNDQRRQAYLQMTENLQQTLRNAEAALSGADVDGFEQMAKELQELEESLEQA